jgi:hypothetical protein
MAQRLTYTGQITAATGNSVDILLPDHENGDMRFRLYLGSDVRIEGGSVNADVVTSAGTIDRVHSVRLPGGAQVPIKKYEVF